MPNPRQYIFPVAFRHIENEELIGVINGANVMFQTNNNFISGHVHIYLNGLKLRPGVGNDYVELSENTIQMNYAPMSGDVIIADYLRKS